MNRAKSLVLTLAISSHKLIGLTMSGQLCFFPVALVHIMSVTRVQVRVHLEPPVGTVKENSLGIARGNR